MAIQLKIDELEAAASVFENPAEYSKIPQAELVINQFRSIVHPYEICRNIIANSNNNFLLYEAGRLLSNSIVRDYNAIFSDNINACKELFNFIMEWSIQRSFSASPSASRKCKGVIAILLKCSGYTCPKSSLVFQGQELSSNASNHLMEFFMNHIESLLKLNNFDFQNKVFWRNRYLALSFVNILLDEISDGRESVPMQRSGEMELVFRDRFDGYDLLILFRWVLQLNTEIIQHEVYKMQIDFDLNIILNELATFFDQVFNWSFITTNICMQYYHIHDLSLVNKPLRLLKNDSLKPNENWSSVLGPDSLPFLLSSLHFLHFLTRRNALVGNKIMNAIVRISTMTSEFLSTSGILILVNHFISWLGVLGFENSAFNIERIQSHWPNEAQEIIGHLRNCDPAKLMQQSSFWTVEPNDLFIYEILQLSEFIVNLSYKIGDLWSDSTLFKLSLKDSTKQHRSSSESQEINMSILLNDPDFQRSMQFLGLMDRFIDANKRLLIRAITLECRMGSLEKVKNNPTAIHEAVEKLCTTWFSILEWLPSSQDLSPEIDTFKRVQFDIPLALTVGPKKYRDLYEQTLQKIVTFLKVSINSHQKEMFQIFLTTRLAHPLGIRDIKSESFEEANLFQNDIEDDKHSTGSIEIGFDELDDVFYENTLFSMGLCALSSPEITLNLLCELVDSRLASLFSIYASDGSGTYFNPGVDLTNVCTSDGQSAISVLEDLHWLILISGHIIVRGPNNIESLVKQHHNWTLDYSASARLLLQETVQNGSVPADIPLSETLLLKASSLCPETLGSLMDPDEICKTLPVVRLLSSLYRLMWFQCEHRIGSGQLLCDNLWFMCRFFYVFLNQNLPEINDPEYGIIRWFKQSRTVFVDPSGVPALFLVLLGRRLASECVAQLNSDSPLSQHKILNSNDESCVFVSCIRGLLSCSKLAISNWHYDEEIMKQVSIILRLINKFARAPGFCLSCQPWFEICEALVGSEKVENNWNRLQPDTLQKLMSSILQGCWALTSYQHTSNQDLSNSPFYKCIETVCNHVNRLLGEVEARNYNLDNVLSRSLVSSLSILDAVASSFSWLFTYNFADSIENANGFSAVKPDPDLLTRIWMIILQPALERCIKLLETNLLTFNDLIQAILRFYANFAQNSIARIASRSGSSNEVVIFLQLMLKLSHTYTKKRLESSIYDFDENFMAEMKLIFDLHINVALREYDLRVFEANGCSAFTKGEEIASSFVIDYLVRSLMTLGAFVNTEYLKVPDLTKDYFVNWCLAVQISPFSLCKLNDQQLSGLFNLCTEALFSISSDVNVQIEILGILREVALFRDESSLERVQCAFHLRPSSPDDKESLIFLQKLLSLIVAERNPEELYEALSAPLCVALQFNQKELMSLYESVLNTFSTSETQRERLGSALEKFLTSIPESSSQMHLNKFRTACINFAAFDVRVAVVTISDSRSHSNSDVVDETGPSYGLELSKNKFAVITGIYLVSDERLAIKRIIMQLASESGPRSPNVIITNGGTGPSLRDNTPDVIETLLDKRFTSFECLLSSVSIGFTKHAVLSRFLVGSILDKVIICLPGNKRAVEQLVPVLKGILPHFTNLLHYNKSHSEEKQFPINLNEPNDIANRQRNSPHEMLSISQATEKVFNEVKQLETKVEAVHFEDIVGRVLAADVIPMDVPPTPVSIKDGYAVRYKDGAGIRKVVRVSCAGDSYQESFSPLEKNCCIRISTGAAIPLGADSVVQVEDTKLVSLDENTEDESEIEILVAPSHTGQDIRNKGSDLSAKTDKFPIGTILTSMTVSVLAAGGIFAGRPDSVDHNCKYFWPNSSNKFMVQQPYHLPVFAAPKIAIFSTGNELTDCGLLHAPIVDTNRIVLRQLLQPLVGSQKILDLGIAKDTVQDLKSHFQQAIDENCDIIVTSGSVSMGEKDLIIPTLLKEFNAKMHFARVKVKPGKPTTFFTLHKEKATTLLFCLPGNPVSTFVTSQLFVLPAVKLFMNYPQESLYPPTIPVALAHDVILDPRPDYRRAQLKSDSGVLFADCQMYSNQLSSCLASCINANLLLKLPSSDSNCKKIVKGSIVDAFLITSN